ncbi:MAG: zf-HC2 domain-containing protein [Phycisphaerae bacterium]|nr:zf-HC2 domain-containing protein [Phycisphaerae bacterium]
MRCDEVQSRLDAYAFEELTPSVASEVDSHLRSCPRCRQSLARLRRLRAILGEAEAPSRPEGFAHRVMASAHDAANRRSSGAPWDPIRWWRSASAPMKAAAAIVLIVGQLVGLAMGRDVLSTPRQVRDSQVTASADGLDVYNTSFLSEAPEGSLAGSYLALVTTRDGEASE